MDWAIVIQARLGSTRLPGKMLQPFHEDKTLFEIVLETLKRSFPSEKIILATSKASENDELAELAMLNGTEVYRGAEEDVLSRFVEVSEKFEIDALLRICADNPFFIPKNLKEIVELGKSSDADYLAYYFDDNLPSIRSHSGFFGEWVSASSLRRTFDDTDDKFFHEHVTNYIYSNEASFKIEKLPIPEEKFCREVRLTIDTREDFGIAREIYSQLKNATDITISELKKIVLSNPKYLEQMARIISQYSK